MGSETIINIIYIISAFLFILGLKKLSSPATARQGNLISALGMLIAVIATLIHQDIIDYRWIVAGIIIGSVIGYIAAVKVQMTQMPEMVALFNGVGGLSSLILGWSSYVSLVSTPKIGIKSVGNIISGIFSSAQSHASSSSIDTFSGITIFLSVIIGGLTFTGSIVAFLKLSERISGKPVLFVGQKILNILIVLAILTSSILSFYFPEYAQTIFYIIIALSFLLGILTVIPIGGADMPVVISLLNSYSGLAACAAGFVIHNNLLIVAGSLVGASGIILTQIMCKAMNRSLSNVLFGGFGATSSKKSGTVEQGEVKPLTPQDAYYILEAANSVVFVPGYGMAVAQAQHVVKELADILENNGAEVRFAIHPVAGRMPGHMNVLLAEANVPYDQLVEMEDINPIMGNMDVAIVIGANDVVNPAANEDESSPIYGMPVIDVDQANTVFVLKRSMASGFAGIENPLFFKDNTRMIFGDAKETVSHLISEFKE